jgi:hypothetical protein
MVLEGVQEGSCVGIPQSQRPVTGGGDNVSWRDGKCIDGGTMTSHNVLWFQTREEVGSDGTISR